MVRLQREGVPLDLETHLAWPHTPLGMALISHLLPARDGTHTCIVDHKEENGGIYGLTRLVLEHDGYMGSGRLLPSAVGAHQAYR